MTLDARVAHSLPSSEPNKSAIEAAYKPRTRAALEPGKRALLLDLSDRAAIVTLIKSADVLIANLSASSLAKHRIDSRHRGAAPRRVLSQQHVARGCSRARSSGARAMEELRVQVPLPPPNHPMPPNTTQYVRSDPINITIKLNPSR